MSRPQFFWTVLAVALVSGVVSCKNSASRANSAARFGATNAAQQVFHVKGVVKEIMPERKTVTIEHETIPNYMEAMTMSFDVKDIKELAGLQPGDEVSFRLVDAGTDGWIDHIAKLGTQPPATPAPDTFRRAREVDPLQVGDLMPDYHFTNELGQAVSLGDFKGQAVAFTFIFTRCPFPTFCPRMSSNFAEAQKQLKTMPDAPTNWHLLTISFDPDFDTPAVLKSYAQRYTADPSHWNFVTGELIDITAIAEQFGLMFWKPEPNAPGSINHNLRTVVVDAQGRVQKVFTEEKWKVDDLVAEMVKAAKS